MSKNLKNVDVSLQGCGNRLVDSCFGFAAFAQANLNVGTLVPGEKLTVAFNAQINGNFPANRFSVTNLATSRIGNGPGIG